MGVKHQAVQWNGNKIVYDLFILAALAAFVGVFMAVGLQTRPNGHQADAVVLLIRALGSAAFLMLTITLTIGPLARFSPRFLPLLYNRRHLGVMDASAIAPMPAEDCRRKWRRVWARRLCSFNCMVQMLRSVFTEECVIQITPTI